MGCAFQDTKASRKITGKSGITLSDEYRDMGFRSHVHGSIKLEPSDYIDRKVLS